MPSSVDPRTLPPGWRSGVPTPDIRPGDNKSAGEIIGPDRFRAVRSVHPQLEYYFDQVVGGKNPQLRGQGLIKSVTGQAEAVKQGLALKDVLQSMPARWFVEAESEHIEKAIIQDGFSPGWHVIEGGLVRRAVSPPLDEGLSAAKYYVEVSAARGGLSPHLSTSYPRGTNHGWPTYNTSDDDLLLHVAMGTAVTSWDSLREIGDYVAGRLGLRESQGLEPHSVTWSRTGPMRKDQQYLTWSEQGMRRTAWTRGYYPRRRHVFGLPAFVNVSFRHDAAMVKARLKATVAFGHSTRARTASIVQGARLKGLRILSDDISGFDQSVDAIHQEALYRLVYSDWFEEKDILDVYARAAISMPALAPPIGPGQAAILYLKDGMTPSGHGGTSIDGSMINLARYLMAAGKALKASPLAVADRMLSGSLLGLFWGDDTLVGVPRGFNADAYIAESERLGYHCRLSEAPVFLMTCYGPDGGYWNLASRSFAQSVWREHPSVFESVSIFGLWVRLTLTKTHPLLSRLWQAIRLAAQPSQMLEKRRIRSLSDLDEHVQGSAFMTELKRDLKTDRRLAEKLIAGLTRGSGDINDNPDAAFAFAMLGLVTQDTSLGRWTPPARLGMRDRSVARAMLDEAIEVAAGERTQLSRVFRDGPTAEEEAEAISEELFNEVPTTDDSLEDEQ